MDEEDIDKQLEEAKKFNAVLEQRVGEKKQAIEKLEISIAQCKNHKRVIDEIEETLVNSFFVDKQFQAPQYQFMLIHKAKQEGIVNEKIFEELVSKRKEQLPEDWKWIQEGKSYIKASHIELCNIVRVNLNRDEDKPAYQICEDKFIKRVNGINKEIVKIGMDKLEILRKILSNSDRGSYLEVERLSIGLAEDINFKAVNSLPVVGESLDSVKGLNGNSVSHSIPSTDSATSKEIPPEESAEENNLEQPISFDFSFIDEWKLEDYKDVLTQCIPADARQKIILHEESPRCLDDIMQESLTTIKSLSEKEEDNLALQYVTNSYEASSKAMNEITDKMKQGSLVSSKHNNIKGIAKSLLDKNKEAGENYEKNEKKTERSQLCGQELVQQYFKRCCQTNVSVLINEFKKYGFQKWDSKYLKLTDNIREAQTSVEREKHFNKLIDCVNKSKDKTKSQLGAKEALNKYKNKQTFFKALELFVETNSDKQLNVYRGGIHCMSRS